SHAHRTSVSGAGCCTNLEHACGSRRGNLQNNPRRAAHEEVRTDSIHRHHGRRCIQRPQVGAAYFDFAQGKRGSGGEVVDAWSGTVISFGLGAETRHVKRSHGLKTKGATTRLFPKHTTLRQGHRRRCPSLPATPPAAAQATAW